MNDNLQTIGFIGLGLMGGRMATRLLGAGYPLTVYNRTHERTRPLAALGAKVAGSPRELAGMAEVVMLSVADDDALEGVLRGPDGVLAGLQRGATVIDLSTVSPRISRAMAREVEAKGGAMLDAPV